MKTYLAYSGRICHGLVFGDKHADYLRSQGYRLEDYQAPASKEDFMADRLEQVTAALEDMCLAHFPYADPNDDPQEHRREFHQRVLATLRHGAPYQRLMK